MPPRFVVGERRLEAFKKLRRTEIPVHVAPSMAEFKAFLKAEADENTCRKDFTPGEGVAIGAAIEEAYKPVAEAASRGIDSQGGKGQRRL